MPTPTIAVAAYLLGFAALVLAALPPGGGGIVLLPVATAGAAYAAALAGRVLWSGGLRSLAIARAALA